MKTSYASRELQIHTVIYQWKSLWCGWVKTKSVQHNKYVMFIPRYYHYYLDIFHFRGLSWCVLFLFVFQYAYIKLPLTLTMIWSLTDIYWSNKEWQPFQVFKCLFDTHSIYTHSKFSILYVLLWKFIHSLIYSLHLLNSGTFIKYEQISQKVQF